MTARGQVVLIAGPMGAGKSTLAANLAVRRGWQCLSEDDFWVENGWGAGLRTPAQEAVVQGQVLDRLLAIRRSSGDAVLELIVYAEPPNPLTVYEQALLAHDVPVQVIVLRPSAAEIMHRIEQRGRPEDLRRLADRRPDVEHQLQVLDADTMQGYRCLDTTGLSADQTCLAALELLRS